eukprot:TRINITY_DN6507_c0_g2_i1.p2 TRINITY_DN6507_c0_g2~~TRINITY_DN6507_c0_g2_i1.p2  ORF type:complete len:206 (-),score=99.73 TRINITY_DN6507_c0_g2_i1:1035-1652(-)
MDKSNSNIDLKVVLLGQQSVGKTCLSERFLRGRFKADTRATVGAAFGAKTISFEDKNVTIGLWDTAGLERFESLSRNYYRAAGAALICYDVTAKDSFDKARFWLQELKNDEPNCALYLIGTKIDRVLEEGVQRGLDLNQIKNIADNFGAKVFETSSKTGHNIENIFNQLARDYLEKLPKIDVRRVNGTVSVGTGNTNNNGGGGCC